ncbi:MAG: hypothetical protein ABSD59_26315 [Terracidiphilus sp.]|jgi:hypothetical protein
MNAQPSGSDNNRGGMGQRRSSVNTNLTQGELLVNAEIAEIAISPAVLIP